VDVRWHCYVTSRSPIPASEAGRRETGAGRSRTDVHCRGISAISVVPRWLMLLICSPPPNASTLSFRPISPDPLPRSVPPTPSMNRQPHAAGVCGHAERHGGCVCMLGRICQSFGRDVIRRDLDTLRQPPFDIEIELDGDC
jgi:hypothetical protein